MWRPFVQPLPSEGARVPRFSMCQLVFFFSSVILTLCYPKICLNIFLLYLHLFKNNRNVNNVTLKHLEASYERYGSFSMLQWVQMTTRGQWISNSKQLGHETVKLHIWKQYNEERDVFFFLSAFNLNHINEQVENVWIEVKQSIEAPAAKSVSPPSVRPALRGAGIARCFPFVLHVALPLTFDPRG